MNQRRVTIPRRIEDPEQRKTKVAQLREVVGCVIPAPDDRKAMTPARKRRLHMAAGGICIWCREPVPVEGPGVIYDHDLALDLGGTNDDENIGPLHTKPCNAIKTANDAVLIAKNRRRRAREDGTRRQRQQIKSPGFQTNLTRGFDGVTRPRKPRRQKCQPGEFQS